jgi:hypothetical protein
MAPVHEVSPGITITIILPFVIVSGDVSVET